MSVASTGPPTRSLAMSDSTSPDIEIARAATLRPIHDIAAELGIPGEHAIPYGPTKAKVSGQFTDSIEERPDGKLILVTAMSPTPAGEGKTLTTVGLGDALRRIGKQAAICLREPSLGPFFGMKGGATGGGRSQVVPMDEINLHFTGDFHAITAAHNLLSALVDNSIHWGGKAGIDARRVTWRRVLDVNDRALRQIVCSLGGVGNGFPREAGFDITAASEIMAILCLANDRRDLRRRLGEIIVGYRRDRSPVHSRDLNADGAMAVLLREAMQPNLVQTLVHTPAFIHGGPFGNIAHGCNSVMATKTALKLADYVVTEAGFGTDLGAEKFFDIKCRSAGLHPDAAVIVATVRAMKANGGVGKDELAAENVAAVEKGCANLGRHLDIIAKFGVPAAVAINRFTSDTDAEVAAIEAYGKERGVAAIPCTHWADGSAGAEELASHVATMLEEGDSKFAPLYPDEMPLLEKIQTVAKQIYGAEGVEVDAKSARQLRSWEEAGYGSLPVCMAKTQYSFSADPKALGAPSGFMLPVREVRLCAGAGFVVAICGEMMTMPGLPKVPSAESMQLTDDGLIEGIG